MSEKSLNTLCVHGHRDANNTTGSLTVPVYQAATFAHPGAGQSTGYDYSRQQNPTREALEKTVALLEGGSYALGFSTGMAAVATLFELFAPGDHIIATNDLYGGSIRLFDHISTKNGLRIDYVDTGDIAEISRVLQPDTKIIFVETPSNPMMQISDITTVAAFCRRHNLLLAVDNTFMTPIYQQPLKEGADIVLHSGTKYLGGHNDTLAGFLITNDSQLNERLRFIYKTIGASLAPWDSFLIQRGIKTLAIRMERITENAQKIASWLRQHPKVQSVRYPGVSGMISFDVDSVQTVVRVLDSVSTILFAESLGGVESLITYPILQTHADVSREMLEAAGINDRLMRLSVGIEDADDLISDLEGALG